MKAKWKLRNEYFRGANTYALGPKDHKIKLIVDDTGVFELDQPPPWPIGMFARQVAEG